MERKEVWTARIEVKGGGGYAEHAFESVEWNGRRVAVDAPHVTVRIEPGAGSTLTFNMRRYVNRPTAGLPWKR